ncbi:sensor histidine kinase [Actinomadura rugatobispora]|uniref:histidine kinase n=1 Tax=Actinomadura rugatobispora TaxID=1994 RepID=A0ABW0ZR69_9ACTN|nr:HAMP domain-containing sensor histidine kinase [Actinomadura rugatobispora]
MNTNTRLGRSFLATVGLVVLLLVAAAVPLSLLARHHYRDEAMLRLERQAVAAETAWRTARHPSTPVAAHSAVGIYGYAGRRFAGTGPARSALAAATRDGQFHEAVEDGHLAIAMPVTDARVMRVSMPYAPVAHRTERTWTIIWAVALALALAASLLTRRSVRLAGRLDRAFARERRYSEHVAHQMRTPLTALLVGLEAALQRPGTDLGAAVRTAVRRGHRLADTVDDLLLLARGRQAPEPLDIPGLLGDVRDARLPLAAEAGRRLTVGVPAPLPRIRAARAALTQILNVLVDNALVHGQGDITLTARHHGGIVAIDVADSGPGVPHIARDGTRDGARGTGLALARALAEAEGGRLLARAGAPTVFTLEVPVRPRPPDPAVQTPVT